MSEITSILAEMDVNQPAAGYIEDLSAEHIASLNPAILERFLYSDDLDNRQAALDALVWIGQRNGYETDLLLLYHLAANKPTTADIVAMRCLALLLRKGSKPAFRILDSLSASEEWRLNYSDVVLGYATGTFSMPQTLDATTSTQPSMSRDAFRAALRRLNENG